MEPELDLPKIPASLDSSSARSASLSSRNVPTGTFLSDKARISSLNDKPKSGEVLGKSSQSS